MSDRRNRDESDGFRVRLDAPKLRGQTFVAQALRQVGNAQWRARIKAGKPPGSRLGGAHVAARFTGRALAGACGPATADDDVK